MLKSLSIYSLITIYQAALAFAVISYFSFKMEIVVFGEYNLYLAIIPFATNILMLGVSNSVGVFYHIVGAERFRTYLGQIIFYFLPASFVVGVILSLSLSEFLSDYFNLDGNILYLIMLLTFLQLLPIIMVTYFQTIQNPKAYAWFNACLLTCIFIATIVSYELYEDLSIIFLAMILVNLAFAILALAIFKQKNIYDKRFNRDVALEIFKYSSPLIIHTAGTTLLFMSDRFFISYFLGNEKVSYYSVSIQLSMVILIAVNAFTGAWGPYLFSQLKKHNMSFDDSNTKKIYIAMLGFLALPFIFYFIQQIILTWFFDAKYKEAIQYVLIIGMGYSMMGIYRIFIGFLHYLKKSVLITILTLSALLINLILNYLFIIDFGVIGVAYSTLISMFLLSVVTIYFANRYCSIQWISK